MKYSWFRPKPEAPALERPLVLVVDGHPADRHGLMRALAPLDVAPLGFGSAEEALTWLDANRPPALLVVDLVLPRMSGAHLAEILRASPRLAGVPIIATSARTEIDDESRALEVGADAFLEKPIHLDELRAATVPLLRGRPARGTAAPTAADRSTEPAS